MNMARRTYGDRNADWPVTSPESRSELLSALEINLVRLEEHERRNAVNTVDEAIAHDLVQCVRAYARLGDTDTGAPMAKRLFSIVSNDPRFSSKQQEVAANYMAVFAYLYFDANQLPEALDLESLANAWYSDHQQDYEDEYLSSFARMAEIYAGQGDFQEALSVVDRVLTEAGSPVRKHPLSKRAGQLAAQRKRYRKLSRKVRGPST